MNHLTKTSLRDTLIFVAQNPQMRYYFVRSNEEPQVNLMPEYLGHIQTIDKLIEYTLALRVKEFKTKYVGGNLGYMQITIII